MTCEGLLKNKNDKNQVDSGPTKLQSPVVVVGSSVSPHGHCSVPTASRAIDSARQKHREVRVLAVSAQQHATAARAILWVMANQILKGHGIVIEGREIAGD